MVWSASVFYRTKNWTKNEKSYNATKFGDYWVKPTIWQRPNCTKLLTVREHAWKIFFLPKFSLERVWNFENFSQKFSKKMYFQLPRRTMIQKRTVQSRCFVILNKCQISKRKILQFLLQNINIYMYVFFLDFKFF